MEVASGTVLRGGSNNGLNVRSIRAGVVTGQAAGFVMPVVIVFSLFLRKSPLYPLQIIGSVLIGPYLRIPALTNALHGSDIWNREVPMFWDWAAHLIFGTTFTL